MGATTTERLDRLVKALEASPVGRQLLEDDAAAELGARRDLAEQLAAARGMHAGRLAELEAAVRRAGEAVSAARAALDAAEREHARIGGAVWEARVLADLVVTRLENALAMTADPAIGAFVADTLDIETKARALVSDVERTMNYNMAGGQIVTVKTNLAEVQGIVTAARAARAEAERLRFEAVDGADLAARLHSLRGSIPAVSSVGGR